MTSTLRITKSDAARRQLEVAIRLYFAEDDQVSIHTLTSAAHQLVVDLNRARFGSPTLKETMLSLVLPEQVPEARRLLNEAANYFKHAERDTDTVLEFLTSQTEILLLDACLKYKELTGELVPTLGVYQAWFWLGPGANLVDSTKEKYIEQFRSSFMGASRRSFYKEAMAMLASRPF